MLREKQNGQKQGTQGPTYLISFGCGPLVHDSLLHERDPEGEDGVYHRIYTHGHGRVVLGVLKAELVVPGEAGPGDGEGRIAESQSCVDQSMVLLELQRVEIVRNGIIGGVLQICSSKSVRFRGCTGFQGLDATNVPDRLWTVIFSWEAMLPTQKEKQ